MKTLVLVVTFNEAENISRLIGAIHEALPEASVLVVDDDSPDGTWRLVAEVGEADPRVQVIRRKGRRGYGSATIEGLRHGLDSGFDSILTLDGDFSHDPADLPRLQRALEGADVAIGSRYVGGVRVLNWDVRRLLLSLTANAYVRWMSGLECQDCTSGFRGYRTSALRKVDLTRIRTRGYAFLPHLLFEVGPVRIRELPICFTERQHGRSKMSSGVIVEALVWPVFLALRRLTGRRGRQ